MHKPSKRGPPWVFRTFYHTTSSSCFEQKAPTKKKDSFCKTLVGVLDCLGWWLFLLGQIVNVNRKTNLLMELGMRGLNE